ncbi:MAG: type pantothenate kinase, partial [Gaiellales bacterium]|nr:type pantothenate kinase [Gaiellales bacterium]
MLLAVDVGNTQTHLGLWRGDELEHTWRIATRPLRTTDDLAVQLDGLLALRDLDAGEVTALVVSSTVPVLAVEWSGVGESALAVDTLLIGPGVRSGIPILMDNPREVGPDRIVNAVAALA